MSSDEDQRRRKDKRDDGRRKSGSERRREHEKRREKRREERDKKLRDESSDRKKEKEEKEKVKEKEEVSKEKSPIRETDKVDASGKRRTLSDLYKELYSDSDGGERDVKASKSEKPEKRPEKKETKKKVTEDSRWSDLDQRPSPSGTSEESSSESSEIEESSPDSSDESSSEESVKKTKKRSPVKRRGSVSTEEESSSSSENEEESSSEESEVEVTSEKVTPVPSRQTSIKEETKEKEIPSDYQESPPHISDHCYARPLAEQNQNRKRPREEEENQADNFENQFANDHGYTISKTPPKKQEVKEEVKKKPLTVAQRQPLAARKIVKFPQRSGREEYDILYRFLTKGLDLEDINYFRTSYQLMLDKKETSKLLNYTHWVDHTITEIPDPPAKKKKTDFSRPHLTGSCRTEGYYKMDPREKIRTKYHLQRDNGGEISKISNLEGSVTKAKATTSQGLSREARNQQRKQLAILGDEALNSDLLRFNQLKVRFNSIYPLSYSLGKLGSIPQIRVTNTRHLRLDRTRLIFCV